MAPKPGFTSQELEMLSYFRRLRPCQREGVIDGVRKLLPAPLRHERSGTQPPATTPTRPRD